jgi:hypothetical protein
MSLNRKDISTAQRGVELQHRHFAFIAATLKATKPPASWDANKLAHWASMVLTFAKECRSTNPRFDCDRFLAACDFVEGEI